MRRVLVLAAAIMLVVVAAADAAGNRPGCNKYCQQSGGFGDLPGDEADPILKPVEILPQTLDGAGDRVVNIRVKCLLEVRCKGAVLLRGGRLFEHGRANLKIPAMSKEKVRVGITRKALESVKEHGGESNVRALVFLVYEHGPTFVTDYTSKRLTLLPPR